jgi:NAD(P)-dependent dehydrogenase (short-subunit alcohol dehydrogenase family)
MKIELQGRRALVTGAGRGIGQSIADVLAENGARVLYTDLDGQDAAAASSPAQEMAASLRLDVTDEADVSAAIAWMDREWGGIDILVNNAGVNTMAYRVTIDAFPTEEWDRIVEVDLRGVYLMSRAAVPTMRRLGGGRIVNIASVAGLVPLRLQCAFTAAKAGVVNLTRAMAIELGKDNILVNAVAPGSTLTEGTRQLFYGDDGLFSEKARQMLDHIPLGRPGETKEIASAVLFLVAPEASYITGHCLTVDGGWTAGYMRDF